MYTRKLIFIFTLFIVLFASSAYSQNEAKLSAQEIDDYTEQSTMLVSYLEGTLNFLGDPTQVTAEKDIIINESYLKIFESDETQVEDDLDPNREMAINKNVQAYMKDIVFFFKTVTFEFEINGVEQLVNENGQVVFKVTMNRNLNGITITGDSLNNNQIRYMEINLNSVEKDLKIASLYTTKPDRTAELKYWWENMDKSWKKYFGDSLMVTYFPPQDPLLDAMPMQDTIPFSEIFSFGDSSFVFDRWQGDMRIDTLLIYEGDTLNFGQLPDSLTQDVDMVFDTTIHYLKVFDTIPYDVSQIYETLRKFSNLITIDISENEELTDLKPLSELNDLTSIYLSGSLITDLTPLRNLNKLEILNCSNTKVNSLESLRFSSNLRELDFSGTKVEDISVLANLKNLNRLEMGNSAVNDLTILAELASLSQADLSGLKIDDFSSLELLPNLTDLNISGTSVTDLSSVGKITNLQSLNFSDTYVTRLSPLSNLKNLSTIQANNSRITLLESLSGMPSLKFIYCDNTGIDEKKAANFMEKNPQTLVIFNTKKLEAWWNELPLVYKSLVKQRMTISDPITTVELHEIINITSLDFSTVEGIESIAPLSMLHRLEKINIDNTRVIDLSPLSGLNNLSEISIKNTQVSSIQALGKLHNLKVLNCENTAVANLLPLQGSTNLQMVYCDNTEVDQRNVLKLRDSIPNCLVLYQSEKLKSWWNALSSDWQDVFIAQMKFDGKYDGQNLQRLVNLETVQVVDNSGISELDPLSWFMNLKTLTVSNTRVSEISPLLGLPYLETLNLPNNPIVQVPGITDIKSLRKLNLESTSIEDLSVIGQLSWIIELNIGGTKVKKLKGIDGLSGLETLVINNTAVKSLKGVEELQNLKNLKCYRTAISSKNIEKFQEENTRVKVEYY